MHLQPTKLSDAQALPTSWLVCGSTRGLQPGGHVHKEAVHLLPLQPASITAQKPDSSPNGSALVSVNEVNPRQAQLVLRWVTVYGFNPSTGNLSRHYVTSTLSRDQLSPAIRSWLDAMRCNEYQSQGSLH